MRRQNGRDGGASFCLQRRVLDQLPAAQVLRTLRRAACPVSPVLLPRCLLLFPCGQRYPAGDLPGESRALAGLLLCLQSLPVLGLLPGGRAVHPALPAAAPAHSQADAAQHFRRRALAGGGPSGPEDGREPVSAGRLSEGKAILPQGFSSLFSFGGVFSFPFCSLKQKENPWFVSSAVPEVLRVAVCLQLSVEEQGDGRITALLLHRIATKIFCCSWRYVKF